ncbi:hypothetical protein PTTG_31156, partial [Puccinia triticina 1-1 BBBD Race 1]
ATQNSSKMFASLSLLQVGWLIIGSKALARPLLEGLPDHDATIPLNLDSNSQARGSEGNSFSLGPDAPPSPNFQEKLSNRKRLLGQDQQHAGQTSPHLSTMERDKGSDG